MRFDRRAQRDLVAAMSTRPLHPSSGRLAPHTVVILAALLACLGGLVALAVRESAAPASLAEVRALARAGKYNRARTLLAPYLQRDPDDFRARLLMAQLATEPSGPDP